MPVEVRVKPHPFPWMRWLMGNGWGAWRSGLYRIPARGDETAARPGTSVAKGFFCERTTRLRGRTKGIERKEAGAEAISRWGNEIIFAVRSGWLVDGVD